MSSNRQKNSGKGRGLNGEAGTGIIIASLWNVEVNPEHYPLCKKY